MADVEPDDDEIRRYVVRWYAYDPQRHESGAATWHRGVQNPGEPKSARPRR
jgi:hypothetical protein